MKTRETRMPNKAANIIEFILKKENVNTAYKRVRANGGAPGIDGLTMLHENRMDKQFYFRGNCDI